MRVSAFTPTRGRPETLALCKEYVARQTHPIHEHIIESGGSLAQNLRAGLPKVTGDVVVIFEDDDHYHPGWVEWCVSTLENYDVAGESATRFYHLPTKGYAVVGTGECRSSLCNTAFRRELIPMLLAEVKENFIPIDLHFWASAVKARKRVLCNPGPGTSCHKPPCTHKNCGVAGDGPPLYVTGMKGLPGTKGMSFSHNPNYYRQFHTDDGRFSMLRWWVGDDDAERYLEMIAKCRTR